MCDDRARVLLDHGGIYLLELDKFAAGPGGVIASELQRWLKFFTEGERLDEQDLPEWMQTEEMRQAMSTLRAFSEKEREYHAYQARQNYLRQQRGIQRRLDELQAAEERARAAAKQAQAAVEQALATLEQAQAAAERERAEKDAALEREAAALAEVERLRRLMGDKPAV
jgi:hypothetical protein